jgi:hypothetical protein
VSAEGRSGRYLWLLLLGLAVGWFEAAVVVYLRALYYPEGFHFPIRIVWDAVVRVEIVREAASLLLDWPVSLSDWDVLFLIPLPWVGPVWAPCLVSLALVGVGSYLFLTAERGRAYRAGDWAVTVASGLLVIASFLGEWRAVIEGRVPRDFPAGLFFAGLLLGLGWFLHAERRERRRRALPP